MRKILSVILLPFVLLGVLLWSAATFARAAFSAAFDRKPKTEVIR